MRLIYTSPRSENIDRVVALFAERGIESTVSNRSNWKRSSYQRFSYTQQRQDSRDSWPQVWVTRAEDYANARALMREIGIEPLVRHGEELAAARNPELRVNQPSAPTRVRRLLLLVVLGVAVFQAMRYYFHVI